MSYALEVRWDGKQWRHRGAAKLIDRWLFPFMPDQREVCGCHRECTWMPHDCSVPCSWPSCLSETDQWVLVELITFEDA